MTMFASDNHEELDDDFTAIFSAELGALYKALSMYTRHTGRVDGKMETRERLAQDVVKACATVATNWSHLTKPTAKQIKAICGPHQPRYKIQAIKEIRQVFGVGLKEAKELAEEHGSWMWD